MNYFDSEYDNNDDEFGDDLKESFRRYFEYLQQRKNDPSLEFPIDFDKVEDLIDYCIVNEHFKEGLELCDYYIEHYPYSTSVWQRRGIILMHTRNFKQAEEIFRQIVHQDPSDSETNFLLSYVCYKQRKFDESLQIIDKLLIADYNEEYLLHKAIVLKKLGRIDESESILLDILESNPVVNELKYQVYEELATLYFSKDDYRRSLKYFTKCLEYDVFSEDLWFYIGVINYELGRYYSAIDAFRNCVSVDPYSSRAFLFMGHSYFQLGRLKQAYESYFQGYEINKDSVHLNYSLGLIFAIMGDYFRAEKYFKDAISNSKLKFIPPYLALILTYKHKGNLNSAIEVARKALDIFPTSFELWLERARVSGQLNLISEAIESYKNAVSFSDKYPLVVLEFSKFLVKLERLSEAKEVLTTLRNGDYHNAEIHFELAKIDARLRHYRSSLGNLKKALFYDSSIYSRFLEEFPSILNKKIYQYFCRALSPLLLELGLE